MKNNKKGIGRIINAYKFSIQGLKYCYKNEAAFRQEIWLAFILLPLALFLGESNLDRVLLIIPIFIVLIVEVLNSAIEASIDYISSERHKLAGAAKDMGSTAVFFALLLLGIVWLIILV